MDRKEIIKMLVNKRSQWLEEFITMNRSNVWTEVSFDEYCIYKAWCLYNGEDYFISIQTKIELDEGEVITLESIKHDTWTLFKMSLGIDTSDIIYKVLEESNKQKDKIKDNLKGGYA